MECLQAGHDEQLQAAHSASPFIDQVAFSADTANKRELG